MGATRAHPTLRWLPGGNGYTQGALALCATQWGVPSGGMSPNEGKGMYIILHLLTQEGAELCYPP